MEQSNSTPLKPLPSFKSSSKSKIAMIISMILLLSLVGVGGFFLGKQSAIVQPTPTIEPSVEPTPTPSPTPIASPLATISPTSANKLTRAHVKENVVAAIETGNTAAIESYMTSTVGVTIQSTECCGPKTRSEAVQQLSYISGAEEPWDFSDTNSIALRLREESDLYGDSNSIIGVASNEYVVAFLLNSDNRIEALTMAKTYKLVLPE